MTHKDSGWRPHLAMHTYEGLEVWDHNVGPHQINNGEVESEAEEGNADE